MSEAQLSERLKDSDPTKPLIELLEHLSQEVLQVCGVLALALAAVGARRDSHDAQHAIEGGMTILRMVRSEIDDAIDEKSKAEREAVHQ